MSIQQLEKDMTIERALRMIAGLFVIASVLLGMYAHPAFLWFTVFVGANLFQSSLTNWCPMMNILKWAGLRENAECPAPVPQSR